MHTCTYVDDFATNIFILLLIIWKMFFLLFSDNSLSRVTVGRWEGGGAGRHAH